MGVLPDSSVDFIEKLKETQRFQFEYFKQLSTLSTASIGAIIALLTKFPPLSDWAILAGLSLLCFVVCLIYTLSGMTAPAKMVQDLTEMRDAADSPQQESEERETEAHVHLDSYIKGWEKIRVYDRTTRIAFFMGVILFLAYAIINILYWGDKK